MTREELDEVLAPKMKPGQRNDPRILVDAEDAWLLQYKWRPARGTDANTDYAVRNSRRDSAGKQKRIFLHRVILDAPVGVDVDHINGNGLDNRRCNLRPATQAQNRHNQRLARNNSSGRKGVRWHRQKHKWYAQIKVAGKHLHLGAFTDLDEAARAYDKAAIAHFGEFALTNEMLTK